MKQYFFSIFDYIFLEKLLLKIILYFEIKNKFTILNSNKL